MGTLSIPQTRWLLQAPQSPLPAQAAPKPSPFLLIPMKSRLSVTAIPPRPPYKEGADSRLFPVIPAESAPRLSGRERKEKEMQSLGGTPEKALKPLSPSRGSFGCAVISAPATDHQARCSVPDAEQGCTSPCRGAPGFPASFGVQGAPAARPASLQEPKSGGLPYPMPWPLSLLEQAPLRRSTRCVCLRCRTGGWYHLQPGGSGDWPFPGTALPLLHGSGGCRKGRGALQGSFLSLQKSGQGQDEAKSGFFHLLLVALGKSVCAEG